MLGWSIITAFTLLVGVIGTLTKNVPATIGIGLGIYMVGAGFGMHLPEIIQKYLFIMNIKRLELLIQIICFWQWRYLVLHRYCLRYFYGMI